MEEAGQLALGIFGLHQLHLTISWWFWIILFLSPDISMLGYLINTKLGAVTYNLFHHKLLAIGMLALGHFFSNHWFALSGWLLFAHASFDRMMGYGLKYSDSFQHTHLGMIGKNQGDGVALQA